MMANEKTTLSEARLAEIRENRTRVPGNVLNALGEELRILQRDRTDLLTEVDRRREHEALLLAIVERVAALDDETVNELSRGDCMFCLREAYMGHATDCPVAMARAALADADVSEPPTDAPD